MTALHHPNYRDPGKRHSGLMGEARASIIEQLGTLTLPFGQWPMAPTNGGRLERDYAEI